MIRANISGDRSTSDAVGNGGGSKLTTPVVASTATHPRPTKQNTNSKLLSSSSLFCYSCSSWTILLPCLVGFFLGCFLSGTVVLYLAIPSTTTTTSTSELPSIRHPLQNNNLPLNQYTGSLQSEVRRTTTTTTGGPNDNQLSSSSVLSGVRILVVLVSFDFSQIPHLEEVLDSYYDVAITGAMVHLVIHTTIPYPVTLIDLWNDRFQLAYDNDNSNNQVQFQITIAVKPKSLRLHLVDCHRQVFYENIDKYDLFIYSEDDIRVTPTTVASYWQETNYIQSQLSLQQQPNNYLPEDFNVGIVRYEYNYPSNVIIDDNTRHATQNVTRVYWEHSSFERPDIVPNAVTTLDDGIPPNKHRVSKQGQQLQEEESSMPPSLLSEYVTMKNHHQGMYLATASLLRAWKARCEFDVAKNRPGAGSQPTEGTQRVWMSSQMLYGGRHCNVRQVLPIQRFGTLTVWHLPNKNYRRVGKYRNRKFADGSEVFEQPHASLLQAMELHLALKRLQQQQNKEKSMDGRPLFSSSANQQNRLYRGAIRMVDEVNHRPSRNKLIARRFREYNAYVQRGGILSEEDMIHTALVDPDIDEK